MFVFIRLMALFGLLLAIVSYSRADDQLPHPIDVLPAATFAPPGFDSNDNAQVVLQGKYMSSCFRMGVPAAEVDQARKVIRVRSRTLYYRSSWCMNVQVPYLQPVELGVLKPGVYDVQVVDTQGRWHSQSRLPVAAARTSAPDDFIYAPVTDAWLDGRDLVELRGTFPDSCMSIADVTVLYRSPNIVELLPKTARAQRPCPSVMTPFQTRVRIVPPREGTLLIHVRTMNGQALNRAVEF